MASPARRRYILALLAVAVLANSVLWLDSLDRYLNSRYHVYLSEYVPDAAYGPSRALQQVLVSDDGPAQVASRDEPAQVASMGEPERVEKVVASVGASIETPASAPQPASDKQGQPASAPVANIPQELDNAVLPVVLPGAHPRILFAGDSMMQGVAPLVISRMRKEYPEGLFVDLSKQSTGLVAKRYFDWPTKIREETLRQQFETVVVFLGPNDPWDIYEKKKRYAFPSEGWEQKYRSRVDEVLDFATAQGIRVIWIGLPVMREERIQQGARIENRIFQEETRKYKFDYLPTEDLLGSLDEPYKKFVEDPKKGKLVVRADDGIHFTTLGLRMISARVEELIRKREKL